MRKFDLEVSDGIVVISVDPWSICSLRANGNDPNKFRENGYCVGNTSNVNGWPNYEYLFENLRGKFYKCVLPIQRQVLLHDDGWLEVSVPMDERSVDIRTSRTIRRYENAVLNYEVSPLRLSSLVELIERLKESRKVYLVRLPVSDSMLRIEKMLIDDFEEVIEDAIAVCDGYLDLVPERKVFRYTDGNHLHKDSAVLISQRMADWISSFN